MRYPDKLYLSFVQANEKANNMSRSVETFLNLLEAVAQRPECSVRELAAHCGRSPSTIQGHLTAMRNVGLLSQNAAGKYRVGWRAYTLGIGLVGKFTLPAIAESYLQWLAEEAGETAHLAVLDGNEALYIAKVEGPGAVRVASQVGMRVPAHASATGKLLLALSQDDPGISMPVRSLSALTPHTVTDPEVLQRELEKISAVGYAVDNQETELGMCCLAVPVRDRSGAVVAALSVSGPCERVKPGLKYLLYLARRTAAEISEALGYKAHYAPEEIKEEIEDVHGMV